MRSGHEAFAKAKKQGTSEGVPQMAIGGAYAAHSAASAPLLKTGRKKPTQMVQASPKKQAGRYQGELVQAMKGGQVPKDSTLKVLKTPSGRYVNAGGTHRHIAREAMGQPTKKIEVASLHFEPHNSLYERVKQRRGIAQLKRGSKAAVAGKNKPVTFNARRHNVYAADAADTNDSVAWKGFKESGGREIASMARMQHKAGLAGAGIGVGIGATIAGVGALEHHAEKKRLQKVGKAMSTGHDAFEISKRDRNTSAGRTITGGLFPGFHAAIAGKPGKKLEAGAYEVGGGMIGATPGSMVGTHLASKKGLYRKLPKKEVSKAAGTTDVAASSKPGKKVQVAYPPEVKAYIESKKSELSKAIGHDAFLLEDVSKALPGPGEIGGALRGVGAIAGGVAKPKMAKVGSLVARNPVKSAAVAGAGGFGLGSMRRK